MPVIKQESYEDRSVYVVHHNGKRKAFDWLSAAQLYILIDLGFDKWVE